jgi:hypothetical protein
VALQEPFESAWLKWGMAGMNAFVLRDNVTEFASRPNLAMEVQLAQYYDASRRCIVLLIDDVKDPFPILWGLLLGDVVHNYRSSLDHLAWALYKRGQTPNLSEAQERRIYFPIFGDRDKFNQSLRTKLPGVRRGDIAIVRRYQPYVRGKTNVPRHVFTVLESLSNADKHRAIQPVIGVPEAIQYDVKEADCILRRISMRGFEGEVKPGRELARFYVKKTGPRPYIEVAPRIENFLPAINARLTLIEFLTQTMRSIGTVLRQFSSPPDSVIALVGAERVNEGLPPSA